MRLSNIYYKQELANHKTRLSRKFFGILVVFVLVIGFILSVWFVFAITVPQKLEHGTGFTIIKGEGVNQISRNLKDRGIIKNSLMFEVYAYLKGVERCFQAAEYSLPEILNVKRLVEILTTGQRADEWDLIVIEGWSAKNIDSKLKDLGRFQAGELLRMIEVISDKTSSLAGGQYGFLSDKPEKAGLEGYLFPDTYRFFANATAEDVIVKMLDNFDRKLTQEMRDEIARQDKTIFNVVIMASIIEREVRTENDRPIVAEIFWKRLDSGMALEADSTINYISGKNTPSASYEDLQIDSLYNTYKYPGLPPGPISNPGIEAIKAAIYPQESDYWFFLTDSKGNVHYANDFEEHIRNKNEYL